MKVFALFPSLLTAVIAQSQGRVIPIFIQPVTRPETPPSFLADVTYHGTDLTTPEILSYEAPEIPEDAKIVRIGVYDRTASGWLSSTSVISVENFSKGYSPHFTISVDSQGNLVGVACRGVRIDAGQTRDFGPQAQVIITPPGKQPDLNNPVLLSPEGKKVVPEEKTFLQRHDRHVFLRGRPALTEFQVLVGAGDWRFHPSV